MQERPSKANLLKIIDLNKSIIDLLPKGDSMRQMYEKMSERLQHRYDTYEQFFTNPYTVHTSLPKFDGDKDVSQHFGDYISGQDF